MTVVITRLFDTYEQASAAVNELESSGIAHNDVSIVANNTSGQFSDPATVSSSAAVDDETATGAGTGARGVPNPPSAGPDRSRAGLRVARCGGRAILRAGRSLG